MIADHLHTPSTHLSRLSQCNHRFYDLFSPILYSNIEFEPCGAGECGWCHGECSRLMAALVQALYRKPHVARHAKHLRLTKWCTEDQLRDNDDPHSDDEPRRQRPTVDEALMRTVLKKVCPHPEEQTKWMGHLKRANLDAWVALLLPALPNLQTIILSVPQQDPTFFRKTLIQLVNGKIQVDNTPALSKLHSVSLITQTSDDAFESEKDAACAVPFFKLPSMRKVAGSSVRDPSDASMQRWTDGLGLTPHSSSVTQLEVDCGVSNEGISWWTMFCRRLESFEVRFGDRTFMDGMHTSMIQESIAGFKRCLRQLRLDYCANSTYYVDEEFYPDQEASSFKEFCVLEDLHIRFPSLIQVEEARSVERTLHLRDVLPVSLQTLHICECREVDIPVLVSEVRDLLSQKATYVPNLRILRVSCGLELELWKAGRVVVLQPEVKMLLQDLCRAVSVEFIQGDCGSGHGFLQVPWDYR